MLQLVASGLMKWASHDVDLLPFAPWTSVTAMSIASKDSVMPHSLSCPTFHHSLHFLIMAGIEPSTS